MLLSPPFLPTRHADQSDEEWLRTAMTSVATGHVPGWGDDTIAGSYPVSLELGWHGGCHLAAPRAANNTSLPVRAIADGQVIYLRPPKAQSNNPTDPLNYGATTEGNCWTSDGVVLIRHQTDIGADTAGRAISVVFYSLYMHLESIAENVRMNRSIYRKDEIGAAGFIYGQPHRIHFEIFCDDANLLLIAGRNTGDLPTGQNGRSSAIFGEMYFHLPAGTRFYAQRPPANQPSPVTAAAHTTTAELIVGVRYAEGDGPQRQRGDATVTTYRPDGSLEGQPLTEAAAEYQLYRSANTIVEAYPANARPAPSAVYELLRFGRIINTTNESLAPADVPHWREVRYPGGRGWVNLNGANVHKFSDADFPHWKGWRFIDDSADQDSRCDSPTIRAWFDRNRDGVVDATEPREALQEQAILYKLEHSICRFPTEWRTSTLDQRWGWLKSRSLECSDPLSEEDFATFKAHAQALCFWERIPAQTPPLPDNPCRFHPRRFIQLFRKCGWMSLREMAQLLPRRSRAGQEIRWGNGAIRRLQNGVSTRTGVRIMPEGIHSALNHGFRKYLFSASPLRKAHFFGQVFQETGALTLNTESGNERYFRTMYEVITPAEAGEDYDDRPRGIAWRLGLVYHRVNGQRVLMTREEYVRARPGQVRTKAQGLGNTQAGDGPRFRGRGLIQLTGRSNYSSYGTYRGRNYTDDPNPILLSGNAFISADVSFRYWVSKAMTQNDLNINRRADTGTDDDATERVTRAVNGGTTHIEHRREYFGYVWTLLNDAPMPANTATLERQLEE